MKAKIRKTGEIVDIIAHSQYINRDADVDYVSYIDSKGIEHDAERGLNFYWDFEPLDTDVNIDWEQRRYELAKAVMQGIWANSNLDDTFTERAKWAVEQADALIAELKNK